MSNRKPRSSADEERYRHHAGRRLEGPDPPFGIHQRDQGHRAKYQYGVIRRDINRVAHGEFNFCAISTGPLKPQSENNNPITAIEIVDHICRLSSRRNLYILTDARIHAPELISYQISADPIEKELCPSLVSREVRR